MALFPMTNDKLETFAIALVAGWYTYPALPYYRSARLIMKRIVSLGKKME